jgi:hypothetical protein
LILPGFQNGPSAPPKGYDAQRTQSGAPLDIEHGASLIVGKVLDSSIHAELAHIWIAVPTENDNPLIERCFCGALTAERSLFRLAKCLILLLFSTSYRDARCLICITLLDGAELMYANLKHGHRRIIRQILRFTLHCRVPSRSRLACLRRVLLLPRPARQFFAWPQVFSQGLSFATRSRAGHQKLLAQSFGIQRERLFDECSKLIPQSIPGIQSVFPGASISRA